MRICSPQLGMTPGLGGGVYDTEILKGLARLGVEIQILLPRGKPYQDVDGWHIHRTPRHIRYYYEHNWLFLPKLLRLWKSPGFDVLRIHSPTIGPLGRFSKTVLDKPVVAHYHHLEDDKITHAINMLGIRKYDLVTTDSQFCVSQLVDTYGMESDRIVVAYPGVEEKYQPRPRRKELERALGLEDKIVLFYLGVLVPRKNLRFLLDVFAVAYNQEPRLRLIIGGTGIEEQVLKTYAQQKGLQQNTVLFVGYIPESDKVDYYNLADVFVFPSSLEGFGMVVAEAMACGVPVVSSNTSSLPEVVGQAGLLASPTNTSEFGQQLLRLVRDQSLRERFGQEGRERIKRNFSWDVAARTTLKAYKRVIERSTRSDYR